MDEEKGRIYTIVAIVALVGLLLSCVAGALAGAATGFLVGRRQGQLAARRALDLPRFHMEHPMPAPEGEISPFQAPLPGMEGALIREVIPGTPADQAGLEAGDVIVALDHTPVNANHPLPDIIRQYEPGDRVTIRFLRANREDSVRVKLGGHPDDPRRAYLGVYFEMIARPNLEPPGD